MGRYTSQSSLETVFGVANIAQWADKEATASAAVITAGVNAAIAWAEDEIDSQFIESRYVTPFVPVPLRVEEWANVLAAFKLYRGRGLADDGNEKSKLSAEQGSAMLDMGLYASGSKKFPVTQTRQAAVAIGAPIVVPLDNPPPYATV